MKVETEAGSNVVKRVEAFEAGKPRPPLPGTHRVSRVATQREADGKDRLEVFIVSQQDPLEVQLNVHDERLQPLLMAAFQSRPEPGHPGISLDVYWNGDQEVVAVRLGEPPALRG